MIVYWDTSSLVAFHLREPGRYEVTLRQREGADRIAVSVLAYVEARAAFARALRVRARLPAISAKDYDTAVRDLNADWPNYFHMLVDEVLIHEAGDNAATYFLRGYDAVHLTSALRLLQSDADAVLFSTSDTSLATAAATAGLPLAHEVTT